jgi:hypothetical protein
LTALILNFTLGWLGERPVITYCEVCMRQCFELNKTWMTLRKR